MRETRGFKRRALTAIFCLFCALALTPVAAFADDAATEDAAVTKAGGEEGNQAETNTATGQVSGSMDGTTFLNAAKDGIITLTGDVTINGYKKVSITNSLTIELGTHTLNLDKAKALSVESGATLNLKGSGAVTRNNDVVIVNDGATLNIDGCTIENTNGTAANNMALGVVGGDVRFTSGTIKTNYSGTAVALNKARNQKNESNFTMTGGTVVGNSVTGSINVANGVAKMSGGTVENDGNNKSDGGSVAVYVKGDKADFAITGGKVEATGEKSIGILADGRGDNNAGVTIDGSANISGTETGVDAYGDSKVTISGGHVAGRYGAGASEGATLTVTGGTVEGTAAGIGTNGGVEPASTINVSGGTIKGGLAGMYLPSKTGSDNINTVTITGGDIYGSAGIVNIGSSLSISYDGSGAPPTVTATGEKTVNVGDADAQQYKPAALIIADQASNSGYNTTYGTGGATINITDGTFINKEQAKTTSPIVCGTFNTSSDMPTGSDDIKNATTVKGGLFSPKPTEDYCNLDLEIEWVIHSDDLDSDIVIPKDSKFILQGSGTPDLTGIADALDLGPHHIDIKQAPEDVADMYVSGGWTATNSSESNITIHNDTGSTGPGLDIKPGETVDVPKENTVVAIQTEHGTISVSNKDAKVGETVTITTKPDEGYLVDSVAVTGKDGKAIEAKDGADGTYTFTMPAQSVHPVTVKAFFAAEPKIETIAVYRLYNQYAKTHIYTSDLDEKATLIDAGWTPDNQDKPLWYAPKVKGTNDTTIYRFFNPYTDDHYFCPATDTDQIAQLTADGWKQDSAASNLVSAAKASGTPVYTLFNKYNQVDTHLYTSDEKEKETRLSEDGWEQHATVIYAVPVTES